MKSLIEKLFQMTSSLFLYYLCLAYVKLFRVDNSDVWLISEMGTDARDNGWHFYNYLKKEHPDIKVKYVISKKSQDEWRIAEKDRVYYRSFEHYILFLTAGKLISSHVMGFSPEFSLFARIDRKGMLKVKGKRVFLQHGITKDYIPNLTREKLKVDLFICGAEPEYKYIIENFGHPSVFVKYTGFARFDMLKNQPKKQILVMPTWRKKLKYEKNFEGTEYYKTWQSLLSNRRLREYLATNNFKMIFYPHYEIQKYIKSFKTVCDNIIIANKKDYDVQQLLMESEILITDYSSVYFDFAYMLKPVYYYQFDYKEYRSDHYAQGYFDYKNDGFGPVVEDEVQLVNLIMNPSDNNYRKRAKSFFRLRDSKNCERIYKAIREISHEK